MPLMGEGGEQSQKPHQDKGMNKAMEVAKFYVALIQQQALEALTIFTVDNRSWFTHVY